MKTTATVYALLGSSLLAHAQPTGHLVKRASVKGFDISHYQPNVDFSAAHSGGLRFVMIKATESTNYIDPKFSDHYIAATKAGFIRGGYHFAQPADSSGATQADYFVKHGGGWTNDGITLPGMLDLEGDCSGLSNSAMVSWIKSFVDEYHSQTTRYPILYFSPSWWTECTGDSTAFSDTCPLDLAVWGDSPGKAPGGWPYQTIWQYADTNDYGGDSDEFNGSEDSLEKLATG
ncbi:MAG: hypothetical protein M1820_008920 [Bogoriella megaspora]|nr:MAG: hypothetical protein M1820_008920 [Bogoriella megaspora]